MNIDIVFIQIKPDPIPKVDIISYMNELKKIGLDKYLLIVNDKNESRSLDKDQR